MTLRRRLLLVYLIIVVLSSTTVGIAVNELLYSRQVVEDLERWQDIMLNVEKLRTAFARDLLRTPSSQPASRPAADEEFIDNEEEDFTTLIGAVRKAYRPYPDFLDAHVTMSRLQAAYNEWRQSALAGGTGRAERARNANVLLDLLMGQIDAQRKALTQSAYAQSQRTLTLLVLAIALTVIHLGIVGAILRRWLLRPMEQLGRQVASLGRDEPPPEPLLDSPAELADLAQAMEQARLSLEELRQRLVESERMTTVGQLAAQLAHNLRNPLASIRAAAQVAARRGNVDDYARARLDEIVAAADRLARWVAGLTEFARPRSASLEPHDIVPLLHQIRDSVAAELSAKDLSLQITAPAEGMFVQCELQSLEQALFAAVVNAIEASTIGGRIVVLAESQGGGESKGCNCRISVIDEGCGLPEGPPDQVFELNFTTKATGMGLGLALARQAIQRQGGTVTARPNPAGGAIVEFQLPIAKAAATGRRNGCPASGG